MPGPEIIILSDLNREDLGALDFFLIAEGNKNHTVVCGFTAWPVTSGCRVACAFLWESES